MKVFYSKRNHVELVGDRVVKIFLNKTDFNRETAIYQKLSQSRSINIPKIINYNEDENTITLEYIDGPTVLELLENLENCTQIDQAVQVLLSTVLWLEQFYKVFEGSNQVMGDVNLRNFIWFDSMVFGIDFESSGNGDITLEEAELFARYLLYDPIESDFKLEVIKRVMHYMNVQNGFENQIKTKVESIKLRRDRNKHHIKYSD